MEDEDAKEQADPPPGDLLPAHLDLSGHLHWLHTTGGQKYIYWEVTLYWEKSLYWDTFH